MGSSYSTLLSSPPFFRPLKRPSSPIASTSQPPKRRKTSYPGNEEDPHPTASQATKREVREECESPSYGDLCHQVFLSHSGHQKSFVEQLFLDLQRENISCFFDKHPQSLPKGEDFPPRIFKAARECRVGVVVLSDEFIASKWPMLELCEFVRAKNFTNGRLKILPLFFRLSTQSLGEKLQDKDSLKRSWQELLQDQKRTTDLDEWVEALKALRSINGILYNEQETEVDYRAKIVSSIRSLLPPKRPYDESQVQGKQRLRQEIARLFNDTPCREEDVKMAANKADGTGEWISLKDRFDIPACLQKNDRLPFLAMKFDNCHFQCPGFLNVELFKNVAVLHLQDMPQLKFLDLGPMKIARSITIIGCLDLQEICGLKSLTSLAYFVIRGCPANIQFLGMEGLVALQHLQVDAILQETITESSLLRWTSFPALQNGSFVGTIHLEHVQKRTGRLDLSACSNLRTIKLTNCKNWTEMCLFHWTVESISLSRIGPVFSNLTELCLVEMDGLKELPTLAGLTALQTLKLMEMHNLKELPTLDGLTSLKWLKLEGMHSLNLLPTLTGLTSLSQLELKRMQSLKELPTLTGLTSLHHLGLEGMDGLKELPALTGLTSLELLYLGKMDGLKELPSLTGLTSLQWLLLEGMNSLKELPTLTGLTSLLLIQINNMHSLKELPTLTGLPSLMGVKLAGMHGLKDLPPLTELTSLQLLDLVGMHGLRELPILTGLPSFRRLRLKEMHSWKELPSFTGLTSLQRLELDGMHGLKELPDLTGLPSLQLIVDGKQLIVDGKQQRLKLFPAAVSSDELPSDQNRVG